MQATQATDTQFYFDEDSAIWHINRERALLLTGARVLLMQIAHPMVAEAVYQHSYVFKKPLLRLHRTLTLTLGMVFGTVSEVHQAIAEIDAAHRPATGRLNSDIGRYQSGDVYNPRAPKQALWVYATLVEGAVSGYETLVAPLSDAMKNQFVSDSALIAEWMGIPQHYLPTTYQDLLDYMQAMIKNESVIVGEAARKIAPFVTAQSTPVVNWLSYPLIQANIALLPKSIREQYGYQIGEREQALIDRAFTFSRLVVPRLPQRLRFAPEYHRAIKMK